MANKYAKHSKKKEARGCKAKRLFDTEEEAILGKSTAGKKPHLLSHYKCKFCEGWHLTSQLPRGNQRAGR